MSKNRCRPLGSSVAMIAFAEPDACQVYSLQDKLQVLPGDNGILALSGCFRKFEGPFFKTLVEKAKTIAFPKNQFYLIAVSIEKDKYVAGQRVVAQLRPDQGA